MKKFIATVTFFQLSRAEVLIKARSIEAAQIAGCADLGQSGLKFHPSGHNGIYIACDTERATVGKKFSVKLKPLGGVFMTAGGARIIRPRLDQAIRNVKFAALASQRWWCACSYPMRGR